jgi:threonine dehydrogenase-like Zn-dependent dehydrogenase
VVRQLTYAGPGKVEWREAPDPGLEGEGEALVRPLAVATCDLDSPLVRGETPFPAPIALGHELVGEVVDAGAEVTVAEPGQRVVVPFQISCGACDACLAGHTGNCEAVPPLSMYGIGAAGGDWGGALSDLVRVPYADAMLLRLPIGVEPVTAASVSDNVADGWRTVAHQLHARPGAAVLVVGGGASGSIGLYAVAAAAALGAGWIDYLDHAPDRLERAAQLGANAIEGDYRTEVGRYLITVDACGDEDGLALALRATGPDGHCTSAAPYFQPTKPLPLLEMYTRCVTLHSGRCHSRALLPEVLAALAGGQLEIDAVTDRVVDWESAPEAMAEHDRKTVFARA